MASGSCGAKQCIRKSQQVRIDKTVAFDGEGVLQAGAKRETCGAKRRELAHKSEGARRRDIAPECVGSIIPREMLGADHGGNQMQL